MAEAAHSALAAACAHADALHRAGRDDEAVTVLSEAAAQLLEALAEGRAGVSRGLLQVLYHIAELQRRLGRMADGLRTARLLRRLAAAAGQPFSSALAALLGAQCCIDSLDFAAAAELLGQALPLGGDARQVSWEAAERALALQLTALTQGPLREQLQQETWHALARFWAAIGRLGDAARATQWLLARSASAAPSPLDAEQLALFLAEVYIDQGRLADFFALARQHDPDGEAADGQAPAAPGDARCWGWRLHRATALQMTARLSDARAVLSALLRDCAHPGTFSRRAAAVILDASTLLVDVLFCLNRLDDAETLLAPLAAQPGYAGELAEARALITARRNSAFVQGVQAELHVSPRELTELYAAAQDSAGPAADAAAAAVVDKAALGASLQRQRRRVRADWQRIAAELRIDLHRGALPSALCRLEALSTWTAALDSPLLEARLDYLSALVAITHRDATAAARHASRALAAAWQLDLPELSWACCRIYRRARQELGQPAGEVLEIEQLLLSAIRARLTPEDRYYYSLNKWTLGEELIRERCADLHRTKDACAERSSPSGVFARWRRHRQERQQLAEILRLYASAEEREVAAEGAAALRDPAPLAPQPRHDVFTLARQQLQGATHAAPGSFPALWAPRWLPPQAALLLFISLPDGVERLLMHGGRLHLLPQPAPISRIRLAELVAEALRKCVLSRSRWRDAQAALRPLRELSAVLGLAELALPDSVELLYIVPDGPLLSLPFALLPVRDRPLAAQLALGILPRPRWSARDPAQPLTRQRGLAVALSSTQCRVPALQADEEEAAGEDYPPLPNAAAEAQLVRDLAGRDFTALTDGEAALAQVLAALPRACAAHFSCHGEFIPSRPHDSGLVLWDQRLTAAHLTGLTFPSLELATLGSCWSGNVRTLPGRDLIGLPWTLLQGGAYSSIAALWKVDDSFNLEFCRVLYQHLGRTGPLGAMAQAQRHFLDRAELRHWGSYVTFLRGMSPRAPLRWALRLSEYLAGTRRAARPSLPLPTRSNK